MTHAARLALVSCSLVAIGLATGCARDPEYAKREYVNSGDRFFEQKKYSEAIVQYRNALQQDARFGEARFKLAQSYALQGDVLNAYREYVRAADALPGSLDAQLKAGSMLLLGGQFEDARARARKALQIAPKNVDAQVLLGNALAGLRDLPAALKELEEAVKLDPKSAAAVVSLGVVQLARGTRPDAEASFRSAVESNPKLPTAHMALANYLWAVGRRDEAEQSLKQALALEPGNLLAHRALAVFYTATGRAAEAESHLRALADSDTTPGAPLKLALADYYLSLNRVDDGMKVLEQVARGPEAFAAATTRMAVVDYTKKGAAEGKRSIEAVLVRDPKNVPALLVKAQFLAAERQFPAALAIAEQAAAVDPTSIQAHFMKGTVYRALNRPDDAMNAFNEVLKLNPKAAAAQVQLAELNLSRGASGSALQFAEDAARQLPNDPVVQLALVRTLLVNGQVARADAVVKPLVARFPNAAGVHAAVGSVALARRDVGAARRAFTKATELDRTSFEALSGLVTVDFADKRPDAARARINERLAQNPNDTKLLILAASVSAPADTRRSEELLRKAIQVEPANMQAFSLLTQLYMAQRNSAEARASLEQAAKAHPEAIGPPTIVAMLYDADGNRAEARKRYERVLQMDPTAAVAANNLAYIYAEDGGNLDVALQLAQRAKEKLPDESGVSDTLGWIYVKKALPGLAIPHLQQAARQEPKNFDYQYHLGVAYVRSGDVGNARKTLGQALALAPNPPQAEVVRQALASLNRGPLVR